MQNIFPTISILLLTFQVFAHGQIFTVSPDSLNDNLFSGKSGIRQLTISNNIGSDVKFEITVKGRLDPAITFNDRPIDNNYVINDATQTPTSPPAHIPYARINNGNVIESSPSANNINALFSGSHKYLSGGLKILLITCVDESPDKIRNALLSFKDIQLVDVFNAGSGTPNINQLLPYQAIILINNYPFSDPAALGNVLADFVDAGRGLIMTTPTFISGYEVQGRLMKNNYCPFNVGNGPVESDTLGSFSKHHPIMRGINNATSNDLGNVTVAGNADLVASWSNGLPCIATKGRNVAAVNAFIAFSESWTGDIPLILHNAALWASGYGWITADPDSGTIPAGSALKVSMAVNAVGTIPGDYNASIEIVVNAPVSSKITIPAKMHVTAAPGFSVESDSMNFGEIFLGTAETSYVRVKNIGLQDLLISSVAIQPAAYSVHPEFAGLDPGDDEIFTVVFHPQTVQTYPGTIQFNSNDPILDKYIVTLSGRGVKPPIIALSQDSFVISVIPGSTKTKILTIRNHGESILSFKIAGGLDSRNSALQFDGVSGFVRLADANELGLLNKTFTVESWIKISNYGSDDGAILGATDPGKLHFVIRNQKPYLGFWGNDLSGNTKLKTNIWYHVAWRYQLSNNEQSIFINGKLDKSETGHSPYSQIGMLNIGMWENSRYFNGSIDEFKIWNFARTEEHITNSMGKEQNRSESGLIGYWNFNEGTGNIVSDLTVNALHGSLQGGVVRINSTAPVNPRWLNTNKKSCVCPSQSSINIELLFDATELDTGDYYATLMINNNDPLNPFVTVPVHMIVSKTVGVDKTKEIPIAFELVQNYPNPFNPNTKIKFALPVESSVRLIVYDLIGREVAVLVNEKKSAGFYTITWDASLYPSGMYIYRIQAEQFHATRKMMLIK